MTFRSLAIALSTGTALVLIGATAGVVTTGAWSWWLLPLLVLVGGLWFLHFAYFVHGFTLDKNGRPLTGRDADLYAQWRASMRPDQRARWDYFVADDDQRAGREETP